VVDALQGRFTRRQVLIERLSEALVPLVGPRLSLEANGGKGVTVLLDGGKGGAAFTRAAPWLPGLTVSRDLTGTARGVAFAVHAAVTEFPPGTTSIGPQRATVTRSGGSIRLQFFGLGGEPLPVVEVPLR
jgi:hypothetical protein